MEARYGGPEYETLATLGSYCGVSDLSAVAYANQVCNEYGLDTIGTGATVAVSFYRDTLGLRFLFAAPDDLAFFDCGGVRLMLSKGTQGEHDHPASILYYRVDDIHAAFATVGDRGARVDGEPHVVAKLADHDLWMAFLRDTEGNVFALMSEVRTE